MGMVLLGLEEMEVESAIHEEWDFPDEGSSKDITSLHPYPGRFIPAIPAHAISKYLGDSSGKHILDPFAGCGTTLVAGQISNHNVTGIDASPIACLLQRCYTKRVKPDSLELLSGLSDEFRGSSNEVEDVDVVVEHLGIPNLRHWFQDEAIIAIHDYTNKVNDIESKGARELSWLALSRVLVRVSNQQSDTQYRAIKSKYDGGDIRQIICKSIEKVSKVIQNRSVANGDNVATIIHGDSRRPGSFEGVKGVDLVVTSPPYPNAYEYWLYHKYRMYWLEMDPIWLRANEIGARPFYSGSGKKGADDYQGDMADVWRNLNEVCNIDATQVWIVGDSVIKGELVDTAQLVVDAAEGFDWVVADRKDRILPRNRSSFQGIGRQNREEVLVFKRGGLLK